jgi:hypothetical protein
VLTVSWSVDDLAAIAFLATWRFSHVSDFTTRARLRAPLHQDN